MTINGSAERKRPNQPPERERDITIRQASCDGLLASRRKVGLCESRAVIPTLNRVHAAATSTHTDAEQLLSKEK